jgi:hypothetical protein
MTTFPRLKPGNAIFCEELKPGVSEVKDDNCHPAEAGGRARAEALRMFLLHAASAGMQLLFGAQLPWASARGER